MKKGRRPMDKPKDKNARGVVWDENTRVIMGSLIAEVSASTVAQMLEKFGVTDPVMHAKQHAIFDASIPFIQSLKAKEDSKAAFFDSMTKVARTQAAHVAVFIGWVLIAAIPFGLLGGFGFVSRYFGF